MFSIILSGLIQFEGKNDGKKKETWVRLGDPKHTLKLVWQFIKQADNADDCG